MHYRSIVNEGNKRYYVSTNNTIDHGPETMIFEIKNVDQNDEYIDWSGIFTKRYKNMAQAKKSHYEIIEDINKYIKGE